MSDAKHIEIGLTDNRTRGPGCSSGLGAGGVGPGLSLWRVTIRPLGGVPGSDSWLHLPRTTAISVGREPGGVAPGVVHLGGVRLHSSSCSKSSSTGERVASHRG